MTIQVNIPLTVKQLISRLDYPCKLIGDPDRKIMNVSAPMNANKNTMIFLKGTNRSDETKLNLETITEAEIVIVNKQMIYEDCQKSVITTNDPLALFIRSCGVLYGGSSLLRAVENENEMISGKTFKSDGLIAGHNTWIHKSARIGSGCLIGSNVVIGQNVRIGNNVTINHNSNIGICGLGYHIDIETKERLFFPHLSQLVIGNSCVIGSGCSLVRGQLTDTLIGDEVRLGNMVNIGHNCIIGKGTVISSSCCVAGGARIGAKSSFGIGATVNAKVNIGESCKVGMATCVTKNLDSFAKVFGIPAKKLPTLQNL